MRLYQLPEVSFLGIMYSLAEIPTILTVFLLKTSDERHGHGLPRWDVFPPSKWLPQMAEILKFLG